MLNARIAWVPNEWRSSWNRRTGSSARLAALTNRRYRWFDGARVPAALDHFAADRGQVLTGERVERTVAPRLLSSPGPSAQPGGDPSVLGDRRSAELPLALAVRDEVVERAAQRSPIVRQRAGVLVEEPLRRGFGLGLRDEVGRRPARLQPRLAERLARVLAARKPVTQHRDRMLSRLALVLSREADRAVHIPLSLHRDLVS
jgi:hypothetical protein